MSAARRTAFAALALLSLASGASPAPPPIVVEFPFGPVVRPGRPVVLRAAGAAAVRIEGGPWAFAAGARGDEFLVPAPSVPSRTLALRLRRWEDDEARDSWRAEVRPLPPTGVLRAVFDPRDASTPTDVLVEAGALPTLPEAWLLFDEIPPSPPGASAEALRAMEAARDLPRPGDAARAAFQPWTSGPDAGAYRALAAAAATAPALPLDLAAALCVLAAAEGLLLLALRRRRPWVRTAWLAAPPLAALGGLAAAGWTASAPIRGVAIRLEGPADTLVVVRLEGPRAGPAGTGSFEVPADAASPAAIAYDADDAGLGVAVNRRRVEATLGPGRSRIVAWREPPVPPEEVRGDDEAGSPSAEVLAWIRARGLDVVPGASASRTSAVARDGIRLRELAPIRVAARK